MGQEGLGTILNPGGGGGGGSTARLGGRELTLCGFNQYTLLRNRDNSGLLCTPVYCSLKLGAPLPPLKPRHFWLHFLKETYMHTHMGRTVNNLKLNMLTVKNPLPPETACLEER